MNDRTVETPAPAAVTDEEAARLSDSGHWAETQVIQSLKDAALRHKDPVRVLNGMATQPVGGIFHPVSVDDCDGQLVVPSPRLRTRLKRLFGYLRG